MPSWTPETRDDQHATEALLVALFLLIVGGWSALVVIGLLVRLTRYALGGW